MWKFKEDVLCIIIIIIMFFRVSDHSLFGLSMPFAFLVVIPAFWYPKIPNQKFPHFLVTNVSWKVATATHQSTVGLTWGSHFKSQSEVRLPRWCKLVGMIHGVRFMRLKEHDQWWSWKCHVYICIYILGKQWKPTKPNRFHYGLNVEHGKENKQ